MPYYLADTVNVGFYDKVKFLNCAGSLYCADTQSVFICNNTVESYSEVEGLFSFLCYQKKAADQC